MGIELDPEFRLQCESLLENVSLTPNLKSVIAHFLKLCDEHRCKGATVTVLKIPKAQAKARARSGKS